ncbi:MAG: glycosyltransferase [Gemmatimonadaceae bacterium]
MRPRIGILSLAVDSWGSRWNSRHQVLTRLAKQFPVLWVNPAPERRRVTSIGRWRVREHTIDGLPENFVVHDSSTLTPIVYRPQWLSSALLRARLGRARASLERRGCTHVVLYLWHIDFADAVTAVKSELSVYHIYDEYSHSEHELPIDRAEERLVRSVGQVFTVSPTMQARKGALNSHSTLISNGVDYDAFATPVPEPADLQSIPHPRIGYTGYIKKQIDWALLLDLAQRRPEWSFVFVGARHVHPEIDAILDRLDALPNVHFLGTKPTSELSRYPQHFDVCLMPYKVNDYTKYIYPLKLHEYLASGRPIVTVPLPALRGSEHLVDIATGAAEWEQAIRRQLEPAAMDAERVRVRRAEARRHDWSVIADRIAEVIRERIAAGGAAAR